MAVEIGLDGARGSPEYLVLRCEFVVLSLQPLNLR